MILMLQLWHGLILRVRDWVGGGWVLKMGHSRIIGLYHKCKDLQRKGLINQVFCLGAVVTIKVRENGPPIKIFHENDLLVYQEMTGGGGGGGVVT